MTTTLRLTLRANTSTTLAEPKKLTRKAWRTNTEEELHVERLDLRWDFSRAYNTWELKWVTISYRRVKKDGTLYASTQNDSMYDTALAHETFAHEIAEAARTLPTLTIAEGVFA